MQMPLWNRTLVSSQPQLPEAAIVSRQKKAAHVPHTRMYGVETIGRQWKPTAKQMLLQSSASDGLPSGNPLLAKFIFSEVRNCATPNRSHYCHRCIEVLLGQARRGSGGCSRQRPIKSASGRCILGRPISISALRGRWSRRCHCRQGERVLGGWRGVGKRPFSSLEGALDEERI